MKGQYVWVTLDKDEEHDQGEVELALAKGETYDIFGEPIVHPSSSAHRPKADLARSNSPLYGF